VNHIGTNIRNLAKLTKIAKERTNNVPISYGKLLKMVETTVLDLHATIGEKRRYAQTRKQYGPLKTRNTKKLETGVGVLTSGAQAEIRELIKLHFSIGWYSERE